MSKGIRKNGTKLGFQKGNKIRVGIKPVNAFIKGSHLTEDTRKKMCASRRRNPSSGMLGKYHTKEWKEKHSQDMLGNKNPNYKGGIACEPY